MALQLEKGDEMVKSKVRVTAYQNHLVKNGTASYGRVQAPSERVNVSNLVASLATRNLGIDPGILHYAAKLFHEEIMRQLEEGKSVEVLGIGTAYISTKGGMKGLNPNLADVPKMTLRFKPAKEIKKKLKLIKVDSVDEAKILPEINSIEDKRTGIIDGDVKKGSVLKVKGRRLRVESDGNPTHKVGIYCVRDTGEKKIVPQENIYVNEPTTLLFLLPNDVTVGASYTLEVITQKKYGDGKYAKTAKTGVSKHSFKIVN